MLMTEHTVTVNGKRYRFEAHAHASGWLLMIEAPGVTAFDVDDSDGRGIAKARDILRGAYGDIDAGTGDRCMGERDAQADTGTGDAA
jgi:hypothetical protein